VTVVLPDGTRSRQLIQISVGEEILGLHVEDARAVVPEAQPAGKDAMLTTTVSGPGDFRVGTAVLDYAVDRWQGLLWDETSGFGLSTVT
jgi:hypothetical protein